MCRTWSIQCLAGALGVVGGTHVAVHDEHSVTCSAFGVDYNAYCAAGEV